jgi:glycine C-acetyltransferase/8-amino-7-oxononanoate synthase
MSSLTTALSKSAAHFARVSGKDLLARTEDYARWRAARLDAEVWPFSRVLQAAPGPTTVIRDETGREVEGLNFGSHDYLGLSYHPAIRAAAERALRDLGPHVSCSPILQGNTWLSRALEDAIAGLVGMEHVLLFPTGWGAGFGIITALVRPDDHIVMDRLAHASLQQGAQAATRNLHHHRHLDVDATEQLLRDLRAKDAEHAILVISEGLFSMDSDTPDLARLQRVCRAYDATLLVDVAHDLGPLGPGGTGQLGLQGVLADVDLVVGSTSKTFASNGGFLATRSAAVKQYVKAYGGPHIFSSGLSPVQAGVLVEAVRIVRDAEGEARRARVQAVAGALRAACEQRGLPCYGVPSPIVAIPVGSEKVARLAATRLFARGVFAHLVEFPAVPVGAARLRLLGMSEHTEDQARHAAEAVSASIAEARAEVEALQPAA